MRTNLIEETKIFFDEFYDNKMSLDQLYDIYLTERPRNNSVNVKFQLAFLIQQMKTDTIGVDKMKISVKELTKDDVTRIQDRSKSFAELENEFSTSVINYVRYDKRWKEETSNATSNVTSLNVVVKEIPKVLFQVKITLMSGVSKHIVSDILLNHDLTSFVLNAGRYELELNLNDQEKKEFLQIYSKEIMNFETLSVSE